MYTCAKKLTESWQDPLCYKFLHQYTLNNTHLHLMSVFNQRNIKSARRYDRKNVMSGVGETFSLSKNLNFDRTPIEKEREGDFESCRVFGNCHNCSLTENK